MKQYNFLSTLLGLTLLWVGTGCSQEEEMSMISAVHSDFVITVAQEGMSGVYSRAVTDETYTTNFEEGDEIGLFAVKDGRIKDDFNNVKVSLNDGNWKIADKNLLYEEDKESGTVYFAYYPYNSELSITSVESPDFFKGLVSGWTIPADQSTEENFEAADLMTTLEGVSASQNEKGQYTIPLKLAHRMAMAVIELPSIHYNFKNEDVDLNTVPYITKAAGIKFYKGVIDDNNEIKPFLVDDDSYRLIIKPDEEPNVVGVANSQQYKLQTVVAAGKYKHFEVGGGRVEKEYLLEIGDYYCSDGSLIKPADLTDTNRKNIIGVVYWVGNAQPSVLYAEEISEEIDVLKADFPNCVHGLVYTVDIANESAKNVVRIFNTTKDLFPTYIELFGLSKLFFWENGKSLAKSYGHLVGYNNMKALMTINERTKKPGSSDGDLFDAKANTDMLDVYTPFINKVCAPSMTTGWYLPSLMEMKILFDNKMVINQSLLNISCPLLWANPFELEEGTYVWWTSTDRGSKAMFHADGSGSEFKVPDGGAEKKTKGYYRFSLAF